MGKNKGKKKSGKQNLQKETPNFSDKKSSAEVLEKGKEVPFSGDDSVGEMLNNALILDESTEIVVVTNSNFQNNNEKQQMITPPQQTKNKGKQESNSNFITDQDVGANSSNKKSSTSSSRNCSYISSGADNSWMEKDPFEVSYSRSIEYNNSVNKKGTKKGNIAPGGELKTIEDYISMGVPRDIAEMKHPLENAWSFWYFRNDKNRSWEENQINLATVDTIEDFWQLYNYVEPASKLGVGCDYALFKKGIMPDWEDYQNKWGGRWIIERADQGRQDDMDEYWLETLFMLIGEHFTPSIFNNIVNGAVIQTKKTKFRLAIWLKDSKDKLAITCIGEHIKKILKIPKTIEFSVHSDGQTAQGFRTSPAGKNRICV